MRQNKFAVIGGTGLNSPELMANAVERLIQTDYGEVNVFEGDIANTRVVFLSRHGAKHSVPPHKVNYRANIAALNSLGVTHIVATNAVGGIAEDTAPGTVIIPDQVIDYTFGREHTFFDSFVDEIKHIDFSSPFDDGLKKRLKDSVNALNISLANKGCYGCTQGPRLENL